jgi:hypothetical protein
MQLMMLISQLVSHHRSQKQLRAKILLATVDLRESGTKYEWPNGQCRMNVNEHESANRVIVAGKAHLRAAMPQR